MKQLLFGGIVVNVFTGELERTNVLIENERIIGVGDYGPDDADVTEDVTGKYICPGLIDGHVHIESTMLTPSELARICLPHGTTSIVADPHEIANVCGIEGIQYMIEASEGIPLNVYFTLSSCVPATPFDEAGASLEAEDIRPLYEHERVVGLAEVMNYPGVVHGNPALYKKINEALQKGVIIDGHAPFLSGRDLDKYILAGITSDHECTSAREAIEKIRKGQWVMIRLGTVSRNLPDLLPLFDDAYYHRCLLVTDDPHPTYLMREGHIDHLIRLAVENGKSAIRAIQMATIHAAQRFGLSFVGAVAPGYRADLLVLNDLDSVAVEGVYSRGEKVVAHKQVKEFERPAINGKLREVVNNSFHTKEFNVEDFHIDEKSENCRVIELVPGQLITREKVCRIDWNRNNGIDTERDILKLAVIERHKNTGHIGLGWVCGIGIKQGAIASSVSHDSHNIIVIGSNDEDMSIAANYIREHGGNVVVSGGRVLAEMALPIAGLMTEISSEDFVLASERVREAVHTLGVPKNIEPFMNMSFVSLSVIPSLKMTTWGLVDVDTQERVSLYCD